MKNTWLFIGFFVMLLWSCDQFDKESGNVRPQLVKKWKQTAYLSDPGDGSGTWQPTPADQPVSLEFTADGKILRDGQQTNTYSVSGDTILLDQPTNGYQRRWLIQELTTKQLQISLMCIEACGERYVPADK